MAAPTRLNAFTCVRAVYVRARRSSSSHVRCVHRLWTFAKLRILQNFVLYEQHLVTFSNLANVLWRATKHHAWLTIISSFLCLSVCLSVCRSVCLFSSFYSLLLPFMTNKDAHISNDAMLPLCSMPILARLSHVLYRSARFSSPRTFSRTKTAASSTGRLKIACRSVYSFAHTPI